MSSSKRPVFTWQQIKKYLDRIYVKPEHRKYSVKDESPGTALEYLTLLQKHHLLHVPFENLTLHYSFHRQICLHPEELYKKIVGDDNGRGGYCMEANCIFGTLLQSLDFNLYSAGARVFEGGDLTGWGHMVNIVNIGGNRYFVDVGFGGNGPIHPVQLERSGKVHKHIGPASARLQWQNIAANTDADQRLWVYEHKQEEQSAFQPVYCFTELEFLPADFARMSYYICNSPRTFFTQTIVCEKKVSDQSGEEIIGSVVLGNSIKWRIHGQKEREEVFKSEEDRIKALQNGFGIKLGQVEKESIRGLVSQIKEQ